MSASLRVNRLTIAGSAYGSMTCMELHGKRLDETSIARAKGRTTPPLVRGSLNIVDDYHTHLGVAKRSANAKSEVLHILVQWPTDMPINDESDEQFMLDHAVEFVNRTLGGRAVFSARLDRDEDGKHTVDVFATPLYIKTTKRSGETLWASSVHHLKQNCQKHTEELTRRNAGYCDNWQNQLRAFQSEWHCYLAEIGLTVAPKHEKASAKPDRLTPEQYKATKDLKTSEAALAERWEAAKTKHGEIRTALSAEKTKLGAERASLEANKATVIKELSEGETALNAGWDYLNHRTKQLKLLAVESGLSPTVVGDMEAEVIAKLDADYTP